MELVFIALALAQWGSFDPARKTVTVYPEAEVGGEGLLDFIAAQTLLHGGQVFAIPPDNVPDDPPLAAVFRF